MTEIPTGQPPLPLPLRILQWIASWMIVITVVTGILMLVVILQCAGWALEVFLATAIPIAAFIVRWRYGKR